MPPAKIDLKVLRAFVEEYLETLSDRDEDKDEGWATPREFAESGLTDKGGFLEWLENKYREGEDAKKS